MKKHDVDSQNPFIMKFKRLYNDAQKRTSKLKHECSFSKAMGKETLLKLNQQKKTSMKNNPINIRMDRILPLALKPVE